tara:strand:- start:446 stop:916 length:471 start_codon:yes stop_codon:yes gene_type:complete
MDITESQKSTIADWVKRGETIAIIQRRLREEMELSLTYMDVRFLVDDLNLVYSEPVEICEIEEESAVNEEPMHASDSIEEPELVNSVEVNVDPVTPPGALVCGTVNFSDGKQMAWQLSAAGQLGLVPGDDPDYRPNPEDLQEFQSQLQQVLQKHGY